MPAYSDGTVPYGAQVITIGGVNFVAENISVQEPTQVIERRYQLGNPTGQVIIPQFETGTATLQAASTSIAPPTRGATFTLVRNDASTVGEVISEVSEPQAQFDIHKFTVSFRKRQAS